MTVFSTTLVWNRTETGENVYPSAGRTFRHTLSDYPHIGILRRHLERRRMILCPDVIVFQMPSTFYLKPMIYGELPEF